MNRGAMLNSNIGEYRVKNFIGAGGMGEVYRAVHAKIGQVVAIKILTGESPDTGSNQRFTWEAQVQARLNHPNIATFHGFTEHQGRACIVMEYVDGQTLSDRIRFSGPLPMKEALVIFQSIVDAVAYIHSHGIIHRDLKSNNIKIGTNGRVKLLDFGIASSALAPKLTMTGVIVGALESLSPEQLNGGRADQRSDIWALGVLLYEMVTGRMPFEAKSVGEICGKTTKGSYPPAAMLNPAVTREVETLIARCLMKNPAERYQSAAALIEGTCRALAVLSNAKPRSGHPITSALKQSLLATATERNKLLLLPLMVLVIVGAFYFLGSTPTSPSGIAKPITIRTTEGPAKVYSNGNYIGDTPLKFEAQTGEWLKLKIERDGYQEREFRIQVGEGPNEYDYTLEKISGPSR